MRTRFANALLVILACVVGSDRAPASPRGFVSGPIVDTVSVLTEHGLLDEAGGRLFVPTVGGITALRVSTGEPLWTTTLAQLPVAVMPDGLIALRTELEVEGRWRNVARLVFVPWSGAPVYGELVRPRFEVAQLRDVRVERGVLRAEIDSYSPKKVLPALLPPQEIAIELATGESYSYPPAPVPTVSWHRTSWGRYTIELKARADRSAMELVLARQLLDGTTTSERVPPELGTVVTAANATMISTETSVLDPRTGRRVTAPRAVIVRDDTNHSPHLMLVGSLLLVLDNELYAVEVATGSVKWRSSVALSAGRHAQSHRTLQPAPVVAEPILDDTPVVTWFGLLDSPGQMLYVPSRDGIDALDAHTGARVFATNQAQLPVAVVGGGLLALRASPMQMCAWQGDAHLVAIYPDGRARVGGAIAALGGYTTLSEIVIRGGRLRAIAIGETPSGIYRKPIEPVAIEIELQTLVSRRLNLGSRLPPPGVGRVQTSTGWFRVAAQIVPGKGTSALVVERDRGNGAIESQWLPDTHETGVVDANATAITLATRDEWQIVDPQTLKVVHRMKRRDSTQSAPLHVAHVPGLLLTVLETQQGPLTLIALDDRTGVERWRYDLTRRPRSVELELMKRP